MAASGVVNSNNSNNNHNNYYNSNSHPKKTAQKCFIYDRRYGLVYDSWKSPSEEALSGGRGMFCIVPLVNALIKSASHTINNLACLTLKVLEKPDPDLFKPAVLQTNINSQLQRVTSSVKKPQFDLAMLLRSQPLSSYPNGERGESHNMEVSSSSGAAR